MIPKLVDAWLSKFKKRFFIYKDGFFELPFLGNSPAIMVKSLSATIFSKHLEDKQIINLKSPFVDGQMHYREIEEGLWIITFDMKWKANLKHYKVISKEITTDFYTAAFGIYTHKLNVPLPTINKFSYFHKSWTLIKPGEAVEAVYYKGTEGVFVNAYFTKAWLEKNVISHQPSLNTTLLKFINSDRTSIVWPELITGSEQLSSSIIRILNNPEPDKEVNLLELKMQSLMMLSMLFTKLKEEDIQEHYFEMSGDDRKKILQSERILMENLYASFPGIENIAQTIGMSATKLKSSFKTVYGLTLFDYYQEKRMYAAREMLENGDLKIKEIAASLGYENVSKFTAAFKKQYDVLPSRHRKPD